MNNKNKLWYIRPNASYNGEFIKPVNDEFPFTKEDKAVLVIDYDSYNNLSQRLDIAIQALKEYSDTFNLTEYGDIAREALKKLEEK